LPVEILAKLNASSGGMPNGIPGSSQTPSQRSDAWQVDCAVMFGFVKEIGWIRSESGRGLMTVF
jgi:hypothetical protein